MRTLSSALALGAIIAAPTDSEATPAPSFKPDLRTDRRVLRSKKCLPLDISLLILDVSGVDARRVGTKVRSRHVGRRAAGACADSPRATRAANRHPCAPARRDRFRLHRAA